MFYRVKFRIQEKGDVFISFLSELWLDTQKKTWFWYFNCLVSIRPTLERMSQLSTGGISLSEQLVLVEAWDVTSMTSSELLWLNWCNLEQKCFSLQLWATANIHPTEEPGAEWAPTGHYWRILEDGMIRRVDTLISTSQNIRSDAPATMATLLHWYKTCHLFHFWVLCS